MWVSRLQAWIDCGDPDCRGSRLWGIQIVGHHDCRGIQIVGVSRLGQFRLGLKPPAAIAANLGKLSGH